jgi:hypothetical protein
MEGIAARPTNALIRVENQEIGEVEILENGVLRTDVVNRFRAISTTTVLTLSTLEPFTPGATVEVRRVGSDTAFLTFTVGDAADTTPPTWDGSFVVDSDRLFQIPIPCFPVPILLRRHEFQWIGLQDDHWLPDELFVTAEPRVRGGETMVGNGVTAHVAEGLCSDEDDSLRREFHRVYDVFVEDGSGNRIGPFEIDTRPPDSAGCTSAPVVPVSSLLLAAACAAAYCSRVRRFPARRPPLRALPPRVLEG